MSNSRTFIIKCSMCFKMFDFPVMMTESKSSLWNFVTTNPRTEKKYAVFCTPNVGKVKGLIKVALKKLPKNHRLVVVAHKHGDAEMKLAEDQDFCLVDLETLNDFSQRMLEIKNQELNDDSDEKDPLSNLLDHTGMADKVVEEEEASSPHDFLDKVISKDRLF